MNKHVLFTLQLVDRFTPTAKQLADAAKRTETAMNAMGQASHRLDRALASIKPPPLPQMAQGFDQVARSANNAATAVANAQKRMNSRDWSSTYAGWRAENKAMEREIAASQRRLETEAKKGGGGFFAGGGHQLMNTFLAAHMARAAVHGADNIVSHVADVETMRRKLRYTLGSTPQAASLADTAVEKARELSMRYSNTTIAENLKILDDLRANLPEDFSTLVNSYAEPFTKLHSFFKSWNGGKHAGGAEKALHDIDIAIRSGELGANVTAAEMANWAQMLAIQRAYYGQKFNLDQFFTAQKSARYALPGTSDRFKMTAFPAMIQAMGPSAGVALATSFNKLVAGITLHQGTLEAWRSLGLVNMDQVRLNKQGLIDPKSVQGRNWVVGGETYKTDPDLFVTRHLLPALAKAGKVKQLTPEVAQKIREAYEKADAHTLSHYLPKILKDPNLIQALGPLGKDRNAVQNLYILIERMAAMARDMQGIETLMKGKDAPFNSYDTAKQRVSASADRLLQAVTGPEFDEKVQNALDGLAGFLDGAAVRVNNMRGVVLGRRLGFVGGHDGKQWQYDNGLRIGADALAKLVYLSPKLAAARAAQTAANPFGYMIPAPEAPTQSWGQWWNGETPTAFPEDAFSKATGAKPPAPQSGVPQGWSGMAASMLPQSEAAREIAIKTAVDVNVTQSIPLSGSVTVNVVGPGLTTGTAEIKGAAQGKADAPRGESSPVTK